MTGFSVWIEGQRRNPLRTSTGFDDVVFAIAFSPDGRTLAIARGAGEPSQRFGRIELWNAESLKLRRVIKGFDGPVKSISFSPDGQTLVSGSLEFRSDKIQEKARSREGSVFGELKWWSSETGELKQKLTLPGEGNSNLRVSYSPDGKDLAVTESFITWSFLSTGLPFQLPTLGSMQPGPAGPRPVMFYRVAMKLLDAETGKIKEKLGLDRPGVIAYSPDGSLIAVGNNNEVRLLNSRTGKEFRKLKGFKGHPNALVFSPNGHRMAVACTTFDSEPFGAYVKIIGYSEVTVFDTRDWEVTRRESEVGAVNTLAFNPSGSVLLLGGVGRGSEKEVPGIILLDLETGKTSHLTTGEDYTEAVDSLVVANDGALLALRSGPSTVKLIDGKTGKLKLTLDASSGGTEIERPASRFVLSVKRVQALAFSRDGKTLAAETNQGEIKLWDPRTGENKRQLPKQHDDPSLVAVASNEMSFAEVSNGRLLFWRAGYEAKQNLPLPDHQPITALAISGDGQLLALGIGRDLLLVGSATGKVIRSLRGQLASISGAILSDDGRTLASFGDNGRIEIWDIQGSRLVRTLVAGSEVTTARFSPNGQSLATAAEDRSITIWNLETGQAQGKLQKHDEVINALAFSPDGRLLASGSDDRNVVVWDTASGKSKRTLKGHDQTVTSLAFSPDGLTLATGSGNAAVVLWEVNNGKFSRVLK